MKLSNEALKTLSGSLDKIEQISNDMREKAAKLDDEIVAIDYRYRADSIKAQLDIIQGALKFNSINLLADA